MKDLNEIAQKGEKLIKSALAIKVGKAALKRGGIVGVSLGAAAGVGYLAYRYFKKNKQEEKHIETKEVNTLNPDIETEKKIVV